jgi:hypothetical protein
MIVISILLYNLYSEKNMEKFESGGVGVDTTEAIKNLGNIAKQLLAGGITVPGNLTVTGGISGPGWKIDNNGNLTVNSIISNTGGQFAGPLNIKLNSDSIPIRVKTPGGNQSQILMIAGSKAARIIVDNNGNIYNDNNNANYANVLN